MVAVNQRIVRGYGLYEQLREHKPTSLIAVDGDGGETKINVPENHRQRWARVMLTLKELAWVRIDLLDKKGGLLYRHHRNADDRDAPAGELEELPTSRAIAEQAALLNIMLRGQEMVLARHQQATQGKDDAVMRIVEAAIRRNELTENKLQESMQLNHQLSADLVNLHLTQLQLQAPQADNGDQPRSDRAVDALLPALMQGLLQRSEAPKLPTPPDKKKNGATPPPRQESAQPVRPE